MVVSIETLGFYGFRVQDFGIRVNNFSCGLGFRVFGPGLLLLGVRSESAGHATHLVLLNPCTLPII